MFTMLLLFVVLGVTHISAEEYWKYDLTFAYANFRGIAEKSVDDSGNDLLKIIKVQNNHGESSSKGIRYFRSPADLAELFVRKVKYDLVELRIATANDKDDSALNLTVWTRRRVIKVISNGATLHITCDSRTTCNFITYWNDQLYNGVGIAIKVGTGNHKYECLQLYTRSPNGELIPLQDYSLKGMKNFAITPFDKDLEPFDPATAEWIPIEIYKITTDMSSKPEFWYETKKKIEAGVKIACLSGANSIGKPVAAVYKILNEPTTEMLSSMRGLYGRFTMSICNEKGTPIEFDAIVGTTNNELQIEVDGSWWTVKKLANLGGRDFHFVAVVQMCSNGASNYC